MQVALDELQSLQSYYKEIKAANHHELMRGMATGHLMEVSSVVAWRVQERQESRFGHGHNRTDYSGMREEFHGSILLKKKGYGYEKKFVPVEKVAQ